jgi:hypothetical protein
MLNNVTDLLLCCCYVGPTIHIEELPPWCNGWCACHWTQGSQVQTPLRQWVFKGNKNLQHSFLRRGSKAGGTMS